MRIFLITAFLLFGQFWYWVNDWGFFGHRKITEMAIYTLPDNMLHFYKKHAEELIELSITPDQRRYVIQEEGPRHYIDMDDYDNPDSIPKYWNQAVDQYGEDFLNAHGLGPWYTSYTFKRLTNAFSERNAVMILRYSSDLAHYIADANVPLHTTSNYNGQKTNQSGIHGFWETRLPELFSKDYDFLVGGAEYISDPQGRIWQAVRQANMLVDSVLMMDSLITREIGEDKKYSFEQKGRRIVRVYSSRFSTEYHEAFPVVEQQMRSAVKMIGDFWFTAWVNGGQPDLEALDPRGVLADTSKMEIKIMPARAHEH